MDNNRGATEQIENKSADTSCSASDASQRCLLEVNAKPAINPNADRPDIQKGLFNPDVPLSHFSQVADGLYRSGRPKGEEGVKEAVEKVWGDDSLNPAHAAETTIIELRGPAQEPFFQSGENEVNAEAAVSAELGITHERFPMQTHDLLDPAFIQSVVDYIDQQKADGHRVLIHCFHGTDRTGTISAAYELTHDPELQKLVKDDPAYAFNRGIKSMTDNGFSPELFPELTQSLNKYVNWKHAQLNDHAPLSETPGDASASSVTQHLDIPSIWDKSAVK